tara:strand:- start:264 stop:689 length:426 start_codon:yes stop_codon:yes gene_type:complete
MKVSSNFYLQEFIDPNTYKRFGASSIWFIDRKIINLAQFIRERLGKPCTVNNWHSGGSRNYAGFDPPGGWRKATSLSQHRFGRAMDLKVKGVTADEVREELENNYSIYKRFGLGAIEDGAFAPTWCHIDVRESEELLIVKP